MAHPPRKVLGLLADKAATANRKCVDMPAEACFVACLEGFLVTPFEAEKSGASVPLSLAKDPVWRKIGPVKARDCSGMKGLK